MNNSYKSILAFDFDGTIKPNNGKINQENLEILKKSNSILKILLTGRSLYSLQKTIHNNFPIDYLVFSSGAGVMDWKTKEIIFKKHFSNDESNRIKKTLNKLKLNYMFHKEIPDNHKFYFTKNRRYNRDFIHRKTLYQNISFLSKKKSKIQEPITQFLVISSINKEKIHNTLIKKLDFCQLIRATSPLNQKSLWSEIFPYGVSKGYALKQIINKNNLSTLPIIGVGNDYNDIDFLKICNEAYMVKDSPKELKKQFKYLDSYSNEPFLNTIIGMKNGNK